MPGQTEIHYFTQEQLSKLSKEFKKYYEGSKKGRAVQHGKHWMVFLLLRYTGARISEIVSVNESKSLNLNDNTIKLVTLRSKKKENRIVQFDNIVKEEYLQITAKYPEIKGKVLKVNRINFYERFREIAEKAGIPKKLSHPNILRHTRAIELLKRGESLLEVQRILGHKYIENTATYLRYVK